MLSAAELDRLARNTGCCEHDDCLTCPLPECVYDGKRSEGQRGQGAETRRRYDTIREMAKYMKRGDIAKQLGISRRTVWYALKEQ